MASVTLDELWIHQVADLTQFVRVYMGSLNEESGVTGEVRRYANGVTRAITTLGTTRRVRVELPYVARADYETLESWVAQPVMVRDPLGRKVFGMFFAVSADEQPIGDISTILRAGFDLSELSLSEEV